MQNIVNFYFFYSLLNLPQFLVVFGRHVLFIRDVSMQNLLTSITIVLAENATIDRKFPCITLIVSALSLTNLSRVGYRYYSYISTSETHKNNNK